VPYPGKEDQNYYALTGLKIFDFVGGVGVARTVWDCAAGRIWAIK